MEPGVEVRFPRRALAVSPESLGQRLVAQPGWAEVAYEPSGLGQVVLGCLASLLDGRRRLLGAGTVLGGAQQEHDAGQTLSQGVVDLPCQPLTFRGNPGRVLGGGEFGPGAGEVVDQPPTMLALGVQCR